jgi:hypothetical protein
MPRQCLHIQIASSQLIQRLTLTTLGIAATPAYNRRIVQRPAAAPAPQAHLYASLNIIYGHVLILSFTIISPPALVGAAAAGDQAAASRVPRQRLNVQIASAQLIQRLPQTTPQVPGPHQLITDPLYSPRQQHMQHKRSYTRPWTEYMGMYSFFHSPRKL